jgi:hypothetical protein
MSGASCRHITKLRQFILLRCLWVYPTWQLRWHRFVFAHQGNLHSPCCSPWLCSPSRWVDKRIAYYAQCFRHRQLEELISCLCFRLATQLCLILWSGGMPVLLACPKSCHFGRNSPQNDVIFCLCWE